MSTQQHKRGLMMPQQSSDGRADLHVWRAGYRAYVGGKEFTDAPPPPDRNTWLAGYSRARTDRARAQDAPDPAAEE